MNEPVVSAMDNIITNIGKIVTGAADWVGDTVGVITESGNELILFSCLIGFVGVGIGLLRRFFKLHA